MTAANKTRPAGLRKAGGILDQIVDAKAVRLAEEKLRVPLSQLGRRSDQFASPAFADAVAVPSRVNIIAEIKRRSPSRGLIRQNFEPVQIAKAYAAGGAAAISVLTEQDFFDGSLDHLRSVRDAVSLPLLRKDFIFDAYQIYEAAAAGASAVLLIAAVLEDELMRELLSCCEDTGLDALVELHSAEELERVAKMPARILGINSRDLRTFGVSLSTSLSLARLVPPGAILVAESGIHSADDICRLREAGFHAFLIGEHLMNSPDVGSALTALIAGT
jgi:indole-3-glycerol phosphate synthase